MDLDDPSGTKSPIYLWNSRAESTAESVPTIQPSAKNSFSFATHKWRCRNSNKEEQVMLSHLMRRPAVETVKLVATPITVTRIDSKRLATGEARIMEISIFSLKTLFPRDTDFQVAYPMHSACYGLLEQEFLEITTGPALDPTEFI
jgi:hypothetical protein